MKALCSILLLVGFSFSAVAQEQCAMALRAEAASHRADASLRLLRGMFEGSSVNAGIAVDRILNEVQMHLADSNNENLRDSFASDTSARSAQSQSEKLQKSIQDLEASLEKKTKSLFALFRKNTLSTQIKERLEELESGKKETAGLIESVKKNIESLREQQLEVEKWEAKVHAEIYFLQEVINRLSEDAITGNASENFIKNFNDEILPRLLQQSNNLMAQQLLMVKTIASGLKAKVSAEQLTLENLQTLQNVSRELAVMKARKFLGQETAEAELTEEQQRANELACQKKDFCAGEVVGYFPEERGHAYYIKQIFVEGAVASPGIYFDSHVVLSAQGGAKRIANTGLARRQPGLSWKGFAVGSYVKSKMGEKYWQIDGIFSDGDFLLKEAYQRQDKKTKKLLYNLAASYENSYVKYNYIRLPVDLIEKVPQ